MGGEVKWRKTLPYRGVNEIEKFYPLWWQLTSTGIYIRGVWAQCCSSPLLCMRITNFLQIYDHPSVVQSGKTFFSPAESIVYYFLLQLLCFLVIMFFSLCLELLLKSQFSHVFVPELGPLQWRSSRKRVSLTVEVY